MMTRISMDEWRAELGRIDPLISGGDAGDTFTDIATTTDMCTKPETLRLILRQAASRRLITIGKARRVCNGRRTKTLLVYLLKPPMSWADVIEEIRPTKGDDGLTVQEIKQECQIPIAMIKKTVKQATKDGLVTPGRGIRANDCEARQRVDVFCADGMTWQQLFFHYGISVGESTSRLTASELAKKFQCSRRAIQTLIQKGVRGGLVLRGKAYGIQATGDMHPKAVFWPKKGGWKALFASIGMQTKDDEGSTTAELAARYRVSSALIVKFLHKAKAKKLVHVGRRRAKLDDESTRGNHWKNVYRPKRGGWDHLWKTLGFVLGDGDAGQTVSELAKEFQVSRDTIRSTLKTGMENGTVSQGRGRRANTAGIMMPVSVYCIESHGAKAKAASHA